MPKYTNAEHSQILDGNRYIPVDSSSPAYRELIKSGVPIDDYAAPVVNIEEARPLAIAALDQAAEDRRVFFTSAHPAKLAVYTQKAKWAEESLDTNLSTDIRAARLALFDGEATAKGLTATRVRDLVSEKASLWTTLASAIEGAEAAGELAINAATTQAEIDTALQTAIAAIEAIGTTL